MTTDELIAKLQQMPAAQRALPIHQITPPISNGHSLTAAYHEIVRVESWVGTGIMLLEAQGAALHKSQE